MLSSLQICMMGFLHIEINIWFILPGFYFFLSLDIFLSFLLQWFLSTFLNCTGIPNYAYKTKVSKLRLINVWEHVIFTFLGLLYLSQQNVLQIHPSTCKFYNFTFLYSWKVHCPSVYGHLSCFYYLAIVS